MKRIFFFALAFAVVMSLNLSAFAAEGETGTESEPETIVVTETVVPDVTVVNEVYTEMEYVDAETTVMSLNPVSSSDANGFKSVLLSVIGDYDAIVVEHAYTTTSGNTSYVREVQYDYPWLCACGLFAIMIFCIFRLFGGLFSCKK